jgi:NAD(P)-dependent dehydrogenase (short-subunit alcohol dehydrogenase family)
LVNNAGIAVEATNPAPVHLTAEETWDKTMLVNAKSVFLGCKYVITQMLAQEPHESGDRGWIVNISSIYGMVGGADNRKYCSCLTREEGEIDDAYSFLLRIQRRRGEPDEEYRGGLLERSDPLQCHLSWS